MSSKRCSYTTGFKLKVIEAAERIGNRGASREYGLSEANVRHWRKNKNTLKECRSSTKAPGRGRKLFFPDVEKKLVEYVHERRFSGSSISTVEVRLKAFELVKEMYPGSIFKASARWCQLFMKRNDISIRRRTSIAQRLPDDVENKLLDYQKYIINLRKRHEYPISCIANGDQTPLSFDMPSFQTLDFKGVKSVPIKTTGNEKNRFTVMLGAYGDGKKMPPYVIFKRKSLPKNIHWPAGMIVKAQENGWMNEELTKDWIKTIWCNDRKDEFRNSRRLLVLDAFRCHRMPCIKEILAKNKTDLVIIPGGMTGQLQVMDVVCNRPFKQEMRKRWNEWFFSGAPSFTASGNRRKVDLETICKWIQLSWDSVSEAIIIKGFKKCCLSNAMDGSEDDIIWQDDISDVGNEDDDMENELMFEEVDESIEIENLMKSEDENNDLCNEKNIL